MTELDLMSHPSPDPPIAPPRRPGAGRTIAAAAVAALLASGLTAGAVVAFDKPGSAASPTAAAARPVSALGTPTGTPDWVAVSAAVAPSVVAVSVALPGGSGDEGSGVVLDKSGHILTNNHVIADAASGGGTITVALADGRLYPASVVGTDPSTDLAVLKMGSVPADLKPATFGDSSAIKVGDPVMAIGNPLGLADTVTTGIVSALNRPVTTTPDDQQQSNPFGFGAAPQAEPVVTNAIQTDAAVNPGNSGGALVNSAGQVIGITSSIASLDSGGDGQSGSIGLGFAIPSAEAKDVADQLIAGGKVRHAYLGVTIGDGTATVDGAKREAAVISAAGAGTPASAAGLRAGDAVIALGGAPIQGADSLIGQIRALDPGTKVTLTVVRGGASQVVTVTLAASLSGR